MADGPDQAAGGLQVQLVAEGSDIARARDLLGGVLGATEVEQAAEFDGEPDRPVGGFLVVEALAGQAWPLVLEALTNEPAHEGKGSKDSRLARPVWPEQGDCLGNPLVRTRKGRTEPLRQIRHVLADPQIQHLRIANGIEVLDFQSV